ncbi:MAG: PA14 domain-containing protein [Oscillatoriaceae cyanobacterium Prado104]|jgi:hypothetical protein|nr:PA14 domain-containing protein [Oscillatoriaceae cyanobacterium Prado104]
MAELNIGALTGSTTYAGTVDSTNIFDLYKFNTNSPGSFKLSIDNLSGNADISLLNSSGTTLYSSSNAGNAADTIADSLIVGDPTLKVVPISGGDIKYTLNIAETNTQQAAADTLTGAKAENSLVENSATNPEKTTANKDLITGDSVGDETVTSESKIATTEVTASSETSTKSETEKSATVSAVAASGNSETQVSAVSETSTTSESEKAVTAPAVAESENSETQVSSDSNSAISTAEKTSETATANTANSTATTDVANKSIATLANAADASKPADKSNTATNTGEDKKTENAESSIPTAETTKEPNPATDKEIIASNPFTDGVFTVDSTGKVGIDYLLDGGLYRGQLAIISLAGMEKFVPGSAEFIKEAAARALSNSEKGYIVIDDLSEGAKFVGDLPEGNFNEGDYLKVKTFAMKPGDKFGFMLVPNDTVKFLYEYPTFGGDKRPLFSMVTANPNEAFHFGQIVDVTGEGNTFAIEDMRFDLGTDRDYNDTIFQVRGATGKAPSIDTFVNPDKDWRKTDLGKAVIAYAKPYITPETETKPNLEGKVTDIIDELEDEVLTPPTTEKATPKAAETVADADKGTDESDKNVPISMPPVKTEDKAKDSESNSSESSQIETGEIDANPTTGAAAKPNAGEDTAADSTEKLPVEKIPVAAGAIEKTDKVSETPPAKPANSADETETVANLPLKVEEKPTFLPAGETETVANSPPKVEVKPTVLPADETEIEVANPAITKLEIIENLPVNLAENGSDSAVKESQQTGSIEPNKITDDRPKSIESKTAEITPVMPANNSEVSQPKEIVSETENLTVSDVTVPQESLPTSPVFAGATDSNLIEEIEAGNPDSGNLSPDVAAPESELDFSVNAELIARLERLKQSLNDSRSADDPSQGISSQDWIDRLNKLTEKLIANQSATVSDRTVNLVERLEETVDRLIQPPIQPIVPSIETAQFDFPVENQPIIGVIDTGFAGNNPDINYSRITWGQDRVDGDADPRIEPGQGNEHGTHVLGIIAANQNNAFGIDGINEKAPIWAGRAIGSGKWAESLVEYVDFVKASGKQNGVINLSMDLIQINPDNSERTRYEFTPQERAAIEYARQHNVLLAVAAGNDGDVMSALGQASQEFDNIITVGAAERINHEIAVSKAFDRTEYSSYGQGLDILAPGGTVDNPELSTVGDGLGTMAGTSVATAKVTGAISQVWAANPSLNYRQVIQIIKDTATDLKAQNWDGETGAGVVNLEAAVALALATIPQEYDAVANFIPDIWSGEGKVTPSERAAASPFWPTMELTNFSAWVMPTVGAYVRSGPGTKFPIAGTRPYQTTIQFDAWTYGQQIPDEQLGTPDKRWYRIAGTNNWMASAVVFGNAPESTPLPPVEAQPQPQPLPPAPLPGQGKLPANAGTFLRTEISNQVTIHYYQNGYLMVQPNGNQVWYSLGWNRRPVRPIPIPKPATVPSPHGSTGQWQAQFWNNQNLSGNPTFTRSEPPGELRFFAAGTPSGTAGIPADRFSARWETTSDFEGGFYNFISEVDDGVRIYVDGVKVVDDWTQKPVYRNDAFIAIPKGKHQVVVEYFDYVESAVNNLRWVASNLLKDWTGELRPVGYDGGSVHNTYVNTYQRNGAISKLGYPTNNVHSWGPGYIQDFEGGSDGKGGIMKSHANDNSYWVGNDFWTTFLATGGAYGILKYPTSDRYSTKSGERQNFQGGAILKSKNGTFPIFGGMAGKYFELGAENSFLGFPTSGEIGLGDGWIIQNFEGGYILYKEGMPTIAYDTKAIEKLPPDSGRGSTSNWHVQFWNNQHLIGSPQWSRYDKAGELRFAAGLGAPEGTRGIQENNFSARWITTSYFDGGIYNFTNQADDGVRVYVDGKLIIDKWQDSAFETKTASAAIEPGYHQVMVEYFERTEAAANTLKWEQANPPQEWAGEFFRGTDLNHRNFAGNRDAGTSFLDKDWGKGHESGVAIGDDNFSDRWSKTHYFDSSGVYKFTSQADDGVRVWVDDKLVIDKWQVQALSANEALVSLDKGYHRIRVEHFEEADVAANKLSWQKLLPLQPIILPGGGNVVLPEPWVAEYFNNRDLSGAPAVINTHNPQTPVGFINFNWGEGSPDSRIQRDNFSSRLTTHRQLPAGTYKFKLRADDGARLFINGEKVIDRWNNAPYNGHEVEITLPAGLHTLQVEHSEHIAPAYLNLDWDYSPNIPNYPIDPALQATYKELVNQLGASAIGVPIGIGVVIKEFPPLLPVVWSNKIQEFRGTLGRGALLKRDNSPTVSYVFGKLWEAYQQAGGPNALGYPLSSQKDLGNGAYELELPNGKLFWAPGMTNPTYYPYFNKSLTIPADSWRGEYFNNRDWAGSPAVVRGDSSSANNLDKSWDLGIPAPGVQADNFSVRWTTNRPFDRGTYRFIGDHDDAFKLEVNGQAPIDKLIEFATQTTGYGTFTQSGQYPVQLKYREYGGAATAKLRMEKASNFILALDDKNNSSVELPDAFNKHGGYDRVGVPINDVHWWGNGYVQDFDGGANGRGILMRRHDKPVFYYVSGKIWDAYLANERGAEGWLGYPTSDPVREGGVIRQNFEGGHITFDGQTATVHRPPVQSQPDPGSGGTNPNMEAFFGWAKDQVGITRRDGFYDYRGQCVTLIARYVQEVFLPADQRTVPRAFGDGKDTARVVSQMLPNNFEPYTRNGLPERGAIISFPGPNTQYGHVGIVMESRYNNGRREVRIMDSNGDNLHVNSTVREYSWWVSVDAGGYNPYGGTNGWTNPR